MEYPLNTVWYIEARPHVPPPGFAPAAASMGSAVAVQLETFKKDGSPHDPPRVRKYLLTCGHVVRGATTDGKKEEGWGALLTEIICFQPGRGYLRTRDNERRSTVLDGTYFAKVHKFSPHVSFADNVPEPDRRGPNDWVLLDVEQPDFQDISTTARLQTSGTEGKEVRIAGFPGGNAGWKNLTPVECGAFPFRHERTGAHPGMLVFDGSEAREGMSGGGVFSDASQVLLGLHRSSKDPLLARYAVAIDHILAELWSKWQARPVVEVQQGETSPAVVNPMIPGQQRQGDPCDDLLAGNAPIIPFINRRKLRDNLRSISQPGSAYKAICMSEHGGTGKSWSRHLVAHIARAQGMVMALIKLASMQNIQAACLRITRDLKLNEADMKQSVLVDQATTETIGQKFAYWLVSALIAKGSPRHLLLVDEIRTVAGTSAALHEELVLPIAKELADVSSDIPLVLILAGAPFPGDETTDPYVLSEEMEPLNDKDVAAYLHDYAARKNRVLSLPEHAKLMQQVTGGAVGTFDKAKMQAVMEATKLILENRVL